MTECFKYDGYGNLVMCDESIDFEEPVVTKESNPKDSVGSRKAPMHVVPMRVMAEVGLALQEGALKYRSYNYRVAGVRASVYFDALFRHMGAWWEGEDLDKDSGLSHVTKAISALVVLRDAMIGGMWTDDRPPKGNVDYAELNKKASALVDRYAYLNCKPYTEAGNALHISDE